MNMTRLIRVLLIDDNFDVHQVVSAALKPHPDIELVGEGYNGKDALALCAQFRPDVLLLDVIMPVMNGIEASKLIRGQFADVKILVISNFQDDESVHAMLRNGADGYIDKGSLYHDLADNIRTIHHGKKVLSEEAYAHQSSHSCKTSKTDFNLTRREKETLTLMTAGLSNREIAVRLGVKEATVKFHLLHVYEKMGVKTRSEALIVVTRNKSV